MLKRFVVSFTFALTVAVRLWRDAIACRRANPSCPTRPTRPTCPTRPVGLRPAARRDRPDRRRLHRFLPVRLRRLDGEEPNPADRSSWGRFDELQERNNETAAEDTRRAAAGRDPASKKDRRLLRVVHGRNRDQREGRRAARSAAEEEIAALTGVNGSAPLVAELHTIA
jgi:hypothetical protein